jgi:hypothetical protein
MGSLVDTVTNTQVNIDYAHHEIHDGDAFSCTYVATASGVVIHIKTGAKYAHIKILVECAVGVVGALYEDPTSSNDGTGLTEVNRNRNSATSPTVAVFHTPTTSNNGTLLESWASGNSTGAARFGGASRADDEWVLKPNESYLKVITPDSSARVAVRLDWYEKS